MGNKLEPIEKFKEEFDFGNIKDINKDRIEIRSRNLDYGVALANRLIKKHKLKLKVHQDGEMAAYNAFEIRTV